MKKKIGIGILIVAIGAGGYFFWKNKKAKAAKAAASTSLVEATQGPIELTVDATGEVSPLNRVEIKPPISGRIEKLLTDEGDNVRAGQVLAWMSSSDRAAILDAARAQGASQYKHWEDTYKPTPILAPLSGVIILKNVVVGQTVDASTVLYAMSDKLITLAQVDEADIGRVHEGMAARITLDAYPDQPIEGKVFQILHEGKNVSNVITYGVKIEPKKVPDFFRSQMTANVNLLVQRKENAVMIPASAVKEGSSGVKRVMVPNGEGKPEPREIETGIESNEKVEVVSGLSAGEKVFVTRVRYTPQKGPQQSPLTMGGSGNNSSRRGSGGSSR